MRGKKILAKLGLFIAALALVALGYGLGQNQRRPKGEPSTPSTAHSTASHPAAGTEGAGGYGTDPGSIQVSPERQQLMGIRTALVEARPLVKKIRTVGIVAYDETRVAYVYTKVEGWIERLFVNYTGKFVQKGQPLFTLYSPDLVSTQEEYLLALHAQESLGSSSIPEVRSSSASLLEAARRRLSLWDIADKEIAEIEASGQPKKYLTLFSPLNGFVIKKEASQGMRVMPDKELYIIADLSTVWVNADIYEFELPYVRVGQKAAISLSYFPGRPFIGRVSWIAPTLDEKTRTVKVRLEFANHDFTLKPEMFANVEIDIDAGKKLAIPDEAVLDSGLRKVVFLDKGEGRFEPREIGIGGKFEGYYEILSGLSSGERILASASFLLDSESRLKEAMGAMGGHAGMEMGGESKVAAAKEDAREKKAGDLTLTLETQPAKPKAGENVLRLKVRDGKGNPVQDAKVSFTANMTMPGMAPVKGEGRHAKEGFYEAKVSLGMAGPWEIAVSVQRPGQKEAREKFTLAVQ